MTQRRRFGALLFFAVAVESQAQGRDRAAFVVTLGMDTLAVERFVRSPVSLSGDLLLRAPRTRVLHYEATLDPAGAITRIELTTQPIVVGRILPPTRVTIAFRGDSAVTEMEGREGVRTMRVRTPAAAMPFVGLSFAMYEAAIMQSRIARRDTLRFALVTPGDPVVRATTVTRRGADSALVDYFGAPIRAKVDTEGRILGADGKETTQKVLVSRLPDADINALAATSAAADAEGAGLGTPSPRDTVRATVSGERLVIDYGRPRKRGRIAFGGAEAIEPWGRVWRTGANAATQLETSANLELGGVAVPAGKYTLWTVLSPTAPLLIVNKQTGQWGTEYRADQDLVRIPLRITSLENPVEQFTILVDATGVLRLRWDLTEFSVPVVVKK